MAYQQTIITPGFYEGKGKAKLLNANQQCLLWENQHVIAGQSSIAIQLERQKAAYYPWGAAIQALFGGAPGTFEIDIEASEDDQPATYVSIVTIVAVNTNNCGRAAIGFTWPKFIRATVITLTNDVPVTVLVTR